MTLLADKGHTQEPQYKWLHLFHTTIPTEAALQMTHDFTATYVGMVV